MAVTRSPPYPPAHPTTTHIVYCSFSHCSLISSGRIVLMSLSIVRNAILISAKFLPACWRDFWASLIREASNLALFIILCTCVWCVVGEEGTSLNIHIINDEGVGWKDSVCVCVGVWVCVPTSADRSCSAQYAGLHLKFSAALWSYPTTSSWQPHCS